ncbi:unnamed protein product, partial [Didymodactylos carnosus]
MCPRKNLMDQVK